MRGFRMMGREAAARAASTKFCIISPTFCDRWQPFVTEREAGGQQDVIYVQPHGDFVRMFIADYDGNELDLVRLDLNGKRLQKWMRDPAQSARSHNYAGKSQQPQ